MSTILAVGEFLAMWGQVILSAGLGVIGTALILNAVFTLAPSRFVLGPLGLIALVAGLCFAVDVYGDAREKGGAAGERLRWETAARLEGERQATAKAAVEAVGDQIVAKISAKFAGLEPLLKSIKDEAANEDAAPLPPRRPDCPDVYRGLPLGSLRKLDALSR